MIISALMFCSIPLNVKAVEDTKSFITIADSFVDEGNPDTNYGGYTYLKVGYHNNWTKTYLKFDLSDAPNKFTKVELRVAILYVENSSTIDLFETNSGWSEYSITWNNAPSFGKNISSVFIPEEIELYKHIKIDITNKLQNVSDLWSIGINSSIKHPIRILPKEGYPEPLIMFYYQTSDVLMYSKLILVFSIGLVIVGVVFYQLRISKSRRQ
jgi:hypothetical protein